MGQLTAYQLSTGYKGKELHSFDSLNLPASSFVCLLGPNGAGKSTLLRILSGLQKPLKGRIELDGEELSSINPRQRARLISVVLTEAIDIAKMRVIDLIATGRSPYTNLLGQLKSSDIEIVMKAAQDVGMTQLLYKEISSLSDGERQKTMIAKSLAQQSRFLFLDEPAAFLDYPSKLELMMLLHRIVREQGKTVLMTTHDVELAVDSADELWLLGMDGSFDRGGPEDLILKNALSDFFRTEQVDFNKNTGRFAFRAKQGKVVSLYGDDSLHKYWMERALKRSGFNISENSDVNIFVNEKGFDVKLLGGHQFFSTSITEVLQKVFSEKY